MAAVDVVTTLGAFVVIVVGVAMLHFFRKLQVGLVCITSQMWNLWAAEPPQYTDQKSEGGDFLRGKQMVRIYILPLNHVAVFFC